MKELIIILNLICCISITVILAAIAIMILSFMFQVSQDYAYCYADDLMPNKTDHYLYIGEITDCTEKPHILYECDGMACKDCFHKECHETTDITHAKNFKYYNGKWVERRDYSPRNLYC